MLSLEREAREMDNFMLRQEPVPKKNEVFLFRLFCTLVVLMVGTIPFVIYRYITASFSYFVTLNVHVDGGLIKSSFFLLFYVIVGILYFNLYTLARDHIWRGNYEDTVRHWNILVTKAMLGWGVKSFSLPFVNHQVVLELEKNINDQLRTWTERELISKMKRACEQKSITAEEVLQQIEWLETVLIDRSEEVSGRSKDIVIEGKISNIDLCE